MCRLRKIVLAMAWLLIATVVACQKPRTEDTDPSAHAEAKPPAKVAPAAMESSCYWPQFHGPRENNISRETGLLKKWPEEGPPRLWTAEGIGDGYGSPVIAGGRIYVSGSVDKMTTVTALNLAGDILWQTLTDEAWKGQYPGTRGTPTIDGERIYHESPRGQVVCLNTQTGKELWSVNILEEFDAKNITWGLAESLRIDGQRVLCCPGGKMASVVALDKNTSETVWTAQATDELTNYATSILMEHQGLRILLTMSQKALIGVDLDRGKLLFRHPHETKYDINATSPIFHDGHIFSTSGYGTGSEMLKLIIDGQQASVESVWKSDELDNHHGGVVLLNGYLYGAAHNPRGAAWICLAWKDGARQYAEKGVGKGSLTCADGMLYTWSEKGQVGLVPATPEKYELVGRFQVAEGGEGPTWAHPVVCGGRLYLRHGNVLHAYDIQAKGE